jgi:hypothetical protein
MSNSFSAIGSALYARLGTVVYAYTTNGTATATGTLGTYYALAPQNPMTSPPYIIVQLASSLDDYTFGTADNKHGESTDYIIKVVSNREWPTAQAYGIYGQAHDALQDAPLTVAGNQLLRCRRTSRIEYMDSDRFWHVGGLYRLDIWET